MQIPVINGIYADNTSDFRTSYPVNFIPVPKQNGISSGYLRPASGIVELAATNGLDRGGINWNGICYRVLGNSLVSVSSSGEITTIGTITGTGAVTMDYSFDLLSISADGKLYFSNGTSLNQQTDPDLGQVVDHIFASGYFIVTDGENIAVTELNDPFSVNPLKYGSSEADPDRIVSLLKVRNEVSALNRYTVETFEDVGGDLFPYSRIEGAQLQRGCVGTFACALFMEAIAYVGSGRNEPCAVWMGANGQTTKISTREIDQLLHRYTEDELSLIVVEVVSDNGHNHLYIHLSDQCLVYDGAASLVMQEPVWFILHSGNTSLETYRARNFVWCYDKWITGDPTSFLIGVMNSSISSHYDNVIGWEFATTIVYNAGLGAIMHELELVCLTGNVVVGVNPTIWTSYSTDGQDWSQEKPRSAGKIGERNKRISWLRQGSFNHWRVQKFRGTSDAHIAVARLEARIEPLNV